MDWLSLFILLICPIMMIFMMKGMHGSRGHTHENKAACCHGNEHHQNNERNSELDEIKEQNKKLAQEIDNLKKMQEVNEKQGRIMNET
ncbi:DUF2933 domain-containing protein [Chengkuizengella sediminis]|uniref:DUF2933 domain-containing protein n=1 Tax=Chengkuizengella sediminis TaxID=1885917 RepID=UPI00138978A3|nr:DUF2933 domain-containing protein [Chengkuizengella sediminis]NDI35240.1 DUF2933 domain-containing protein [Chengkuizengella sediminis]